MLEIQPVSATYPVFKAKRIHKDEYRQPDKPHRNNPKLEEHDEELDESTLSQHIDERA